MTNSNSKANSRRHARKVTLDAALSNAIAKAVDARKVAAFTVGAAGVLAGAAFAFGATPAMAAEAGAAPDTKPAAVTAGDNAGADKKAEAGDKADKNGVADEKGKAAETGNSDEKGQAAKKEDANKLEEKKQAVSNADEKKAEQTVAKTDSKNSDSATTGDAKTETTDLKATATYSAASSMDRAATPAPAPKVSSEITISKETKDTLPNMYAWGSSDNVYIEKGQSASVKITLKSADGIAVTKVAIFPSDGNNVSNTKSRRFLEYYSASSEHQPYSGEYGFTQNQDGSVTLTVNKLYRNNNMPAEGYAANRCIYVYGNNKEGKEVLLYKTNIVRASTLIPPKTAGSIVLKYNEELTDKQIREKLQKAIDAPTEATGKKSIRAQIDAASRSNGVGVRDAKKFTNTPDTAENKVIINDQQAYLQSQVTNINTATSQADAKEKTYKLGAQTLKTYLISDFGYKSEAIPLTVARYDTRIDKPVVDEVDITKLTDDQKAEICKKLAQLNHVTQDKVKFNDQGEAVINFDGVDEKDAPKIALRDLVLKNLKAGEYAVPSDAADSKVKPVIISNPLGFTKAEETAIKKAIYEANKDKPELGLSPTDYANQITLDWNRGNLTGSGTDNQGISNGDCENTIHVTIKTDKAIAKFDSDVKHNKLTRLVNLRTDYTLSWDANKNKINGRDKDEGLAWMEDGKTLVYRYDSDNGTVFNTEDVLGLLKATLKDNLKQDNPQMRTELLGSEYKTVAHEGQNGQKTRSHTGYAVDKDGNPIGVLNLSKLNGSSYGRFSQPVSNSDKKMGDEQASVSDFTFDDDSKTVKIAGKTGKFMLGRLFIEPYSQYHYNNIYGEGKYNLRNNPKGINIVFMPQTKHKTKDLKGSIDEHKLADDNKTPTESKYYNASDDKKQAYDKALDAAKTLYNSVKDTDESKLNEEQKAQIDNVTINLNKARAELDGDKTDKKKLEQSIKENGKAAEGTTAATPGTVTTDKYKNVTVPSFLKEEDGKLVPDTDKNNKAAEAKKAYDNALEEANKVSKDDNATQKAVDDAKAKLDAARKELDKYSTNKDKLNAAIAEHGQVNTGDSTKTDPKEKIKTADPAYQNSTKEEREAYDKAVSDAQKVVADPNASQKEVNEAITALETAKKALDAKATNKAKLAAAVQQTFDNPDPDNVNGKKSTFYQNAKAKAESTDPNVTADQKSAAEKAYKAYDEALKKAKEVLEDKDGKATQAQVDAAVKALTDAEDKLHEGYSTNKNDLTKALADNIDGYLKPAYFNAFDKAQAGDKDAADAFKNYNDAYQKAKALKAKFAKTNPAEQPTDDDCKKAKEALDKARQVIDKYATDTSKLSAAFWNDIAIQNSPAYKNAAALAGKQSPTSEEQAQVEAAKKIKKAYDDAVVKLHKAFSNTLDKDKGEDGADIPVTNIPDAKKKLDDKDYLKNIQKHANGEPLDRDVTDILTAMNDAADQLKQFATKTDKLQESINKDTDTQKDPAYKNAKDPHKLGTDGMEDTSGYAAIKEKATAYDNALKAAKELMVKPDATQEDVNTALKNLDDARKALNDYKTNVDALKESVKKNGKEKQDNADATEGTVTSDAYRNASDPHFLDAQGKPDDARNNAAKQAKADYDKALAEAQELLKKADAKSKTPLDAQPTQKQIDDALTKLDKARKKLEDNYKTNTDALNIEVAKSTAEGATATGTDFENSPEFKNADDKKGEGNKDNDDVAAYKKALNDARDLLAKKDSATLSERPTQKQIDEALDALKKAKQTITDGYKTDVTALKDAKDFVNNVLKKSPEYQNAVALKDDQSAAADKKTAAQNAVNALDENTSDSALKKAKDIIDNPTGKTQKEVDAALDTLQKAMKAITDGYKTNADKLKYEVGDKDEQGKDVTPPFEASVAYKNALEKAKTETDKENADSATKKLEAYNEKLKAAQDLIAQVNSTDPNADPTTKPTQKDVDDALDALKKAKQAIADAFKTNASALKNEADDKDEHGNAKADKDKFEKSTEYTNALAKTDADGKDNADIQAYNNALKKANELLALFGDDGNPKDNLPAGKQIPSQQEVDEAKKALKEIKEKILKNYVTSPHDLQQEFDKSKDGADDNRNGLFEDTPAFKNAQAKKDEDGKDNVDMAAYKKALEDAKKLLDKFDRTTGKPKPGETAPTQKQLDDALQKLQEAKSKIEKDYATKKEELQSESDKDADFTKSPEYQNATGTPEADAYKKALENAKKVLDDPNATQAQVDDALKKLQDAKKKLTDDYGTSKHELRIEHSDYSSFESSPEFINVISNLKANPDDESAKSAIDNYKKALEDANKVLGDPNATQAQVDAALSRLRDAKNAITQKYATDKKNLKDEHEADSDFENSPEFQNAAGTPEAEAYKKALEDAKKVLNDPNATQAQVDEALRKLRDAKNALVNSHKTDKSSLQNEADDDPVFRNGVPYLIAGSPEVDDYKKALDEARRVLADPNATQAQVDAALRKLREAKQRIIDKFNTRGNGFDGYVPNAGGHEGDGYANNANANAVDKSALQAEINSALNVRGNSAAAQAYKNALAEAKRVLADANATQAQVDAAVKQLRDAKAAFNGFGGSDHHLAKTGAGVGLFAGLAAIFAGFGAAGVASRRRKHSND